MKFIRKIALKSISTKYLVEELTKREGVREMQAFPHKGYRVECQDDTNNIQGIGIEGTGPAIILIVED